jgi:eukaryotic-like serine/threonine-protein kinase
MDSLAHLKTVLAGRYDIERDIGRGGMATVYLARDLKHQRNVALKVLDPELGAVLGSERFLSEIRVTANLHHPHLLPLFDSGEAGGLLFYVMPFVDGESLRAKLDRERQLPVDEAVRIAAAVAGALDHAHQHGVIHRDLKPENILLQGDQPVVADFGIALAVSNAGGTRVTQTGLSLGTPQYMSPEQATGDRVIDKRTDIYSLGAVVYEMLTGEPPHTGATVQAIVARVLTERPQDMRSVRAAIPEHVADAVTVALEKLPADRWSSAREFADAMLGRISSRRAGLHARTASRLGERRVPRWVMLTGMTALAALAVGALAVAQHYRAEALRPTQFVVRTRGQEVAQLMNAALSVSPDGRAVVYAVGEPPRNQLYIRTLDDVSARSIPGTEGAFRSAFSPDGRSVVFATSNRLMRVSLAGGTPLEIASIPTAGRLTWTRDDMIVMSRRVGLAKVSANGGIVVPIGSQDTSATAPHPRNPIVLDDGKTIVYASAPGSDASKSRLAITTIDGAMPEVSSVEGTFPIGAVDDYIVYVTWFGPMKAVQFDRRSRKITGTPVTLANDVLQYSGSVLAALSPNGTLAYVAGSRDRELVWVDDKGAMQPAIAQRRQYDLPRLSPDGKFLATIIFSEGTPGTPGTVTGGYWTYEFSTGALRRLTTDTNAYYGVWSPDGRDFYHSRGSRGQLGIWREPVDGSGPATPVFADSMFHYYALSSDGHSMVYHQAGRKGNSLFVRAITGDTASRLLIGFPEDAFAFRISPDGRWLAYTATEGNAAQVFVRSISGTGPRVQVSTTSGIEPVWSADGKQIFYRDQTGREMFTAGVRTAPNFAVDSRRKLFEGAFDFEWDFADYDVTPDGKRFLMVRTTLDDIDILVTTNWRDALRRRVRATK